MIRFEAKWWAWGIGVLVVLMIFVGPGTMRWFFASIIHGIADVVDALVRGLTAVRDSHS
jgi:hypothetical protein